ncbi:MAG: tyrosyl-tRNA synthetase, partial [Candidatus Adlerbacteria bacterium]|nr:tyrosyl-tRNA synthetase [Candidatus Adlerbacteria bacterium]
IYFGIDPTGAKLHLGHAVPLRKLRQFHEMGHEVIFLVGSFTAMIGDPTGRDAARTTLTRADVEANFQTYKQQAEKILDLSAIEVRYNNEWLDKLDFEQIVNLASNFTVQQMLQRDMFEKRIADGKPISLHEFLYPLMVGYDSVVLDVDVELGGSDQEFNMLAGRHLQARLGKRDKFVMTTKLLEGTDGRKMSKTYDNCVYLNDASADMYGKLMSIKDELVRTYFEVATDLDAEEINSVLEGHPKEAKMRLAREVVEMYHSADAATKAESDWQNTFSDGGVPENISESVIQKGTTLLEALAALGESKSELRRLLEAGAVGEVGGEKLSDSTMPVERDMVLRIGKHRFLKITVK